MTKEGRQRRQGCELSKYCKHSLPPKQIREEYPYYTNIFNNNFVKISRLFPSLENFWSQVALLFGTPYRSKGLLAGPSQSTKDVIALPNSELWDTGLLGKTLCSSLALGLGFPRPLGTGSL